MKNQQSWQPDLQVKEFDFCVEYIKSQRESGSECIDKLDESKSVGLD